jgi:glucose-1-phosphate thymidylyltransferase
MIRKGIILAGGMGSRMSPLTKAVNKQLLPLYDKPLIFYPISVLMLAGIKKILIIVNKNQLGQFNKVLPVKNNLGISIEYKEQAKPEGLPQAFTIGEKFIGKDNVSLILGDNFFYGQSLTKILKKNINLKSGAKIFTHPVKNPHLYGVASLDKNKKVVKTCRKTKKKLDRILQLQAYIFLTIR